MKIKIKSIFNHSFNKFFILNKYHINKQKRLSLYKINYEFFGTSKDIDKENIELVNDKPANNNETKQELTNISENKTNLEKLEKQSLSIYYILKI